MTRPHHPIHRVLLDAVWLSGGGTLLDLGCGDGETLAAAHQRQHGDDIAMVGIDTQPGQLAIAADRLGGSGSRHLLVRADLDLPLPIRVGCVDSIVSHNVLEYLRHPTRLLSEAARVLRPGGQAVWSHVDFAGIIINAADSVLNRQVLETHATFVPKWMGHADGYLGRRLPGLVRRSPLILDEVEVHLITSTMLDGDALRRVNQIRDVLRPAAQRSQIGLSLAEVDRWLADLKAAEVAGEFFFCEPTVVVTSRKPIE